MVPLLKTGPQHVVPNYCMNPKQPDSFHSGRWNTTSNPDLAFAHMPDSSVHRIVLDRFPKSQHRPSLIDQDNTIEPVPTKPVKRWNFRKQQDFWYESIARSLRRTLWCKFCYVNGTQGGFLFEGVCLVDTTVILGQPRVSRLRAAVVYVDRSGHAWGMPCRTGGSIVLYQD